MSVESLLAESRALVERSRLAIAEMQTNTPHIDRKRKKMNNTEGATQVTASESTIVDAVSRFREETSFMTDAASEKKIEGELTADAAGRMYSSGMSVDAVAKSNGISYPKARRLIRESGVELRDPSARLKGRTRKSK